MDTVISIEGLKNKLKDIFCIENKQKRRYSEIWLSDVDFGGLYQTDKFNVNVKVKHQIESCNKEIEYIATQLFKELSPEESSLIWRVIVYNSNEQIHCQSDDIMIYSLEDVC